MLVEPVHFEEPPGKPVKPLPSPWNEPLNEPENIPVPDDANEAL
jgi:hypothetical protein